MSHESVDERIDRLHAGGIVDLHFDLPMDLYEKRNRQNVLEADFDAEFKAGGVGVIAAATYIEDKYLPEKGLQVALAQIARLYAAVHESNQFAICKSYREIVGARAAKKIAFIIAMEGVEPLGDDLDLLRGFYEIGLRIVGLTHARRNAAGHGGIFAATGSSPQGLTEFGRDVVRECESLGIIVDLAHINPAGFSEIVDLSTRPLVV
jgi:membrane dipeptidase